jgi:hypothetical protein
LVIHSSGSFCHFIGLYKRPQYAEAKKSMLKNYMLFSSYCKIYVLTIAIITLPSNSKRQKVTCTEIMIRLFIIEMLFANLMKYLTLELKLESILLWIRIFRHSFNNSICFLPTSTTTRYYQDLLIEAHLVLAR